MNGKYGVGLIGAGWVAGEYVKAFRDHPSTEIIGIYNRTPGKATQLMQSHGVDAVEYLMVGGVPKSPRLCGIHDFGCVRFCHSRAAKRRGSDGLCRLHFARRSWFLLWFAPDASRNRRGNNIMTGKTGR